MIRASKIIDQIKDQEKKGLFKSRRRLSREFKEKKYSIREVIYDNSSHIQRAIGLTGEFKVLHEVNRIIIAGVGINAIAAQLLKDYLIKTNLNIEVTTGFSIPEDAGLKTLVFITSYTGTDKEPMSCYRMALRKGCKLVALTSGGPLLESVIRNNKEHLKLPANIPESVSFPYIFFPILKILENSSMIPAQKKYIDETTETLKKSMLSEMGDALSENLKDKIPIICSSPRYSAVTASWKAMFNLVAGISSFTGLVPDIAHIDLAGYGNKLGDLHLVIIKDDKEPKEIERSIKAIKSVIKKKGYSTTEIMVKGKDSMTKMLSAVAIGGWTALELRGYYGNRGGEDLLLQYKEKFNEPF